MRAIRCEGALSQPRSGVARHDAVAWGYARAADSLGVDIIQGCEVQGIGVTSGAVTEVMTSRGTIRAEKVGIAVAGNTSHVAAMAGLRLPIETHLLQAMVTEPVKPVLDTVVRCTATHTYISQTDKGELRARRRSRRLRILRPARQPADGRACPGGLHRDPAADSVGCASCVTGPASWT